MRYVVPALAIACAAANRDAPLPVTTASSFCAQGVPGLNHACSGDFGVSGQISDGAYVTSVFTRGSSGAATRTTGGTLADGDCTNPPSGMSADACRELLPAVCSAPVLQQALAQSGLQEQVATVDCHGGWAVASLPSGERVFRFLKGAWHPVPQAGTSCHDWFLSAGVPIDACEAYHARQAALTATR
jgi:hypothetical protein